MGRTACTTVLDNQSDATGRAESIALFTTLLRNGNLFFVIGVAPRDEEGIYSNVFRRVAGSVRFSD